MVKFSLNRLKPSSFNVFNSLYTEVIIKGEKIVIIKPLTYMNLSGQAVKSLVDYYKIDIKDILVIQDDLDLEVGVIKLKKNSSSGGHNGIKSIITELGSNEFARLKIGISNSKFGDTKDYVLGKFNSEEMVLINEAVSTSKKIIDSFIHNGIDKTMNIFNTK